MNTAVRAQDEWLALRCLSGEPDAFEDLVHIMERPLLYYPAKLLGNEERAVDALQDVWIRVFNDHSVALSPAHQTQGPFPPIVRLVHSACMHACARKGVNYRVGTFVRVPGRILISPR